jgi:hypothetical protein
MWLLYARCASRTFYAGSRGYRRGRVTMLGAGRPRNCVSIPSTGTLSTELKWPGNEPDNLPLSSSAFRNVWSYSSNEPYTFIFCTGKALYLYIYIYIYIEMEVEFCAAEWTVSSIALQQLVSSAPRPLRTGLAWFLRLTSTAEREVSHGATQHCTFQFICRFTDRDPLQAKRSVQRRAPHVLKQLPPFRFRSGTHQ